MRANLRWLSMLLPLLVLAALHSPTADAQSGQTLRVEPALLLADIAPGESKTITVTVRADEQMKVEVTPRGLGQSADGGFKILPEDQDVSAYTGRAYVKAAPRSFSLDAGKTKDVRVTIEVPEDAGDGGRYAILEVKGKPPGADDDANVGIGASIGASVVVTLEGTTQTRAGDITEVSIAPVQPGQPIAVNTALKNTGNYHFGASPVRMYAAATLRDPNGNTVVSSLTPMTETSLVPTYSRAFGIAVGTREELVPGRYAMEVQVGLEDGTILDRATEYVDVAAPVALGEAAAPVTPGDDGDNAMLYIVAALIAAAVVMGILALIAARRRRAAQGEGE